MASLAFVFPLRAGKTEEQAINFALQDAWLRRWPRSHTAIHPIGKGAQS